MAPNPLEHDRVELAGYTDLDGRPGFKIDMQVVDDRWYVYLGHFWDSGWSVVDVTDPEDPELVTFVEGPDGLRTAQLQVADGLLIAGLENRPDPDVEDDPAEEYTGAYIFDVETDPTDPQLLGHYQTGGRGTHRNFYAGGDYAYMCACPAGFEPTQAYPDEYPAKNYHLRIVDVSDPTDPTEVSTWMWPGQHPNDVGVPKENRYFHGPAYVVGDRAYLSYGRVGMVTLDLSDITDPKLVSKLGFGEGLGGYNGVHSYIPVPGTDLAAVNSEAILEGSPLDRDNGDPLGYTFLVDISQERPPVFNNHTHLGPRVVSVMPLPVPEEGLPYESYYEKVGRFGPHNQHHPRGEEYRFQSSDYLVMAYFNAGIRIFDISNPAVPTEAGYFVPEDPAEKFGPRPREGLGAQVEDVAVDSRGYIYCTEPNRGMMVLETDLF